MFNGLILIHQYILIAQSNLLKYMNNFFKYLLKIFWKLSEFFQIFCLVLPKFSSSFCPNISILRYIICENSYLIKTSLLNNNNDKSFCQYMIFSLLQMGNNIVTNHEQWWFSCKAEASWGIGEKSKWYSQVVQGNIKRSWKLRWRW